MYLVDPIALERADPTDAISFRQAEELMKPLFTARNTPHLLSGDSMSGSEV